MEDDKEVTELKKDKIKARNKGQLKELAENCNYLGSKYTERGRHEDALEEHQEELALCVKLKDALGTAVAYRCIGECYAEMEDYGRALENLKVYMEMAEEMSNGIELQRSWATLGRTYFMKGDNTNAEISHNMAAKLAER